jgi:tRNA1Val (adenine37-N6)-methyltransferase
MVEPDLSHDTLFDGKLTCTQSRAGYRFSIDAVLLAHFAAPRRSDRVLDLGAGCGVVSLILAYRHPAITLTCLEIQDSLIDLIRFNIEQNDLADRLRLLAGDLRHIKGLVQAGAFDLIVCNPPYYRVGTGVQNPNAEQAGARHELTAELPDVVRAAAFALRTKGRLVMIYPAARGAALIATLRQHRLEPKRLQAVYPYPGADASLLLLEAIKCGGEELTLLPPLYIYDRPDGEYSPPVEAFYRLN